jgi:hypothetical protein
VAGGGILALVGGSDELMAGGGILELLAKTYGHKTLFEYQEASGKVLSPPPHIPIR